MNGEIETFYSHENDIHISSKCIISSAALNTKHQHQHQHQYTHLEELLPVLLDLFEASNYLPGLHLGALQLVIALLELAPHPFVALSCMHVGLVTDESRKRKEDYIS